MADLDMVLETVFEKVKARFAEESPGVAVHFGWREPAKQVNQGEGRANRVLFVPGASGAAGEYRSSTSPGTNPRPLGALYEQCTVYCWAFDGSVKDVELAQYRAARKLHNAVVRAISLAARASDAPFLLPVREMFTKPEWVLKDIERPFGAELKFVLTVPANIPDSPFPETDGIEVGIGSYLNDEQDATDIVAPEPEDEDEDDESEENGEEEP